MSDLTQLELQYIRQCLNKNEEEYQKINYYMSQVKDVQTQQIFSKIQQEALNSKQTLMIFLNN